MTTPKKTALLCAAGALLMLLAGLPRGLAAAPWGPEGRGLSFSVRADCVLTPADDLDNGFGAGASLGLALNDYVGFELSAEFSRVASTGTTAGTGPILDAGHLSQIPIQLLVRLRLPLSDFPITPFATGGAGIAINSFSLDDTIVSSYNTLGFDAAESVKSSFVWSLGGGLEYAATDRLMIEARFLYRHCTADGTFSLTDQITGESATGTLSKLNLSSSLIGLGITYKF